MQVPGTSLLNYAISVSFLLIAIVSPFLTSLADFSGRKKLFLQVFCYLGAASCAGLFFFSPDTLTASTFVFIAATVGFSGSIVFYNSYLPEISSEEKYDSLSARGFSMGYIGSVILLVICLVINQFHDAIGIGAGRAAQLSFLLTGIWWAGFAQIPFATLPADRGRPADALAAEGGWLLNGFRELGKVWDQLKQLPNVKKFLLAYFTYNMGVQTVMYVATLFGTDELHLESGALILTILLLQVVAIAGAYLFAKLSERIGNTRALSWSVFYLDADLHCRLLRAGRLELLHPGRRHRPDDGCHPEPEPQHLLQNHPREHAQLGGLLQLLRRDREAEHRDWHGYLRHHQPAHRLDALQPAGSDSVLHPGPDLPAPAARQEAARRRGGSVLARPAAGLGYGQHTLHAKVIAAVIRLSRTGGCGPPVRFSSTTSLLPV